MLSYNPGVRPQASNLGRLWTDFSSGWVKWYGLVEQVTDINEVGPSSLKISTDSTPENGTSAARLRGTRLRLSGINAMTLRLYVEDITLLSKLEIRFSSVDGMATYLGWSLSRWKMSRGWNEVMVPIKSLTANGAESIDNTMVSIQVSVTGTGGAIVFDSIYVNRPSKAAVIFRFDDGWTTQYAKAFPILKSYGYVGTVGVISNYVGTTGYATVAQLLELQSYGWEIFNHTANHSDLTTIDPGLIRSEVDGCRQWMNQNGFRAASDIVAYPYGSFNQDVLNAMKGYRLGLSTQAELELAPPVSPLTLKTLTINNDTENSVYEAAVNQAVETGSTLIILLHRIEDSGTDEMIYHTDKFATLVDFIAGKSIEVSTFSEWLL